MAERNGHASRSVGELISDCVHCGFCLPACPTYVSWAHEADSPRGRIDLMKGLLEGAVSLDATAVAHFDRCLGCMGCVTACPSGVRYDALIEATRARVEDEYRRPIADRSFRALIFALFPYPGRLRALAGPMWAYAASGLRAAVHACGLLERLPARLAQLEKMLPPLQRADLGRAPLPYARAHGPKRARVALVAGCVQRVFFPNVNDATIRVLQAEGCEVIVPQGQGCCGALSLHSGRAEEAKRFARALIERFERDHFDTVVINAAGCGSTLKQYGELLAGDPLWAGRAERFAATVRDVTEFLVELGPRAPRRPLARRVAYHDACHLAHAQRIRSQPRELLATIPGLELVEIPFGDQCCGSAGTYNLFEPESAHEIGARKVDNVLACAPDLLASANPGCTLQIAAILRERGRELPTAHPVELLDLALNGPSVVA